MSQSAAEVTELLRAWADGDSGALNQLVPVVYESLRSVARARLRRERPDHTIDTTALVHETYLKLVDIHTIRFRDRTHFLSMVSRVMRRVLVDYARVRNAAKRGSGVNAEALEEALLVPEPYATNVLELHEALERLEKIDERQARIIEHRFFGGLALEEIAQAMGVSLSTVKSDLRFARAWLVRELSCDPAA
jgi:RNA polymerase sigma factor (TIGR02999 family)